MTRRSLAAAVTLSALACVPAATAQSPLATRWWLEGSLGAGASRITEEDPPRLRGSSQVLATFGLVVPLGSWGVGIEASFSREVSPTDCNLLAPPSCFAEPFSTIGLAAGTVRAFRGPIGIGSSTVFLGAGAYHVLRTHSSNGNLPATTTFGAQASGQVVGWRSPRAAALLGARAVVLPRLHGQTAWMFHLTLGFRRGR